MKRSVEYLSEKIIHVTYEPDKSAMCECNMLSSEQDNEKSGHKDFVGIDVDNIDVEWRAFGYKNKLLLSQKEVTFSPKTLYEFVVDGEPVIKKKMTANGEVSYIENGKSIPSGMSFSVKVSFEIGERELLLGLGQYEDGVFDYRNKTEYLYESNMRIAIPFLVTTGGYGIFIDSESNMIFQSMDNTVSFSIDTSDALSYYIFFGDSIQDIVRQYHAVTGKPSMLPRWAFGYIQSKERYNDADELLDVAATFRDKRIPVDCLVQDWYTWAEGLWGEKIFDKKRYPDMAKTIDKLHENNIHLMVSIWPNMSPDSSNYAQFKKAEKLLPNSNTYDAFDESARSLYWRQCEDEIMLSGTDALWCDNAEPFSDADWSGEFKKSEADRYKVVTDMSKESMNWKQLNSYGLYHAKGIYENWRKSYPAKRVVNLTRSGYSGCQKYGTILWSGDITATWNTLRKQIVEGMKMGLTGMPYWTLDIGGFFVVNDKYENRGCNDTEHKPLWFWKGDYNDGAEDLGYRELYVRWLQFGAFLPIFRSHGTDTPREPWRFGSDGDIFYDTIVEFIKLRYKLMPYIYSLGAKAHFDGDIIMRSLVIDFADDPVCKEITDEYLFGDAFLVAPVYTPMYYTAGSCRIEKVARTRRVYLPKGIGWYDYYTREYYEGGIWVDADATLPKMPLFVRAGSIIPVSDEIQYADELNGEVSDILVYEGADGHFTLYIDDGDGYDFEKGKFECKELYYCDATGELSTKVIDNIAKI